VITKDVTRIKQPKEVVEGQLSCINEILEADENISPASHSLIEQNMAIIVMAVKSLTE
jgi:uncharacterized protein YabE (DUF348 family)